jgi:hypothetical protein
LRRLEFRAPKVLGKASNVGWLVVTPTPGVPHVFQGFAAVLDEGGAALDRASTFLET